MYRLPTRRIFTDHNSQKYGFPEKGQIEFQWKNRFIYQRDHVVFESEQKKKSIMQNMTKDKAESSQHPQTRRRLFWRRTFFFAVFGWHKLLGSDSGMQSYV